MHALSVGKSGIAIKGKTGRRIGKPGSLNALSESVDVEMNAAAIEVDHGKERFPAQAVVQSQLLIHLPGVRRIQANVLGTLALVRPRAHYELGCNPDEKVPHAQPRRRAVEGHAPGGPGVRFGDHPPRGGARANSKLVVAANSAEIIAKCEGGKSTRPILDGHTRPAGDVEVRNVRVVTEHLDSNIGQPGGGLVHVLRTGFATGHSIRRQTEGVDDVGSEQIGITDRERLGQAISPDRRVNEGKNAMVQVVRGGNQLALD